MHQQTQELAVPLDREAAAFLAHELNRALRKLQGDHQALPWIAETDHTRDSVRLGVDWVRNHPDAGPREAHEHWMAYKAACGWEYGPVKDEGTRRHPCMMPWDELPIDQQLKDKLFIAVVRAVS